MGNEFKGFTSTQWETEYMEYIKKVSIYPKGNDEIEAVDGSFVIVFLEESYLVPALASEVGELASIFAKSMRDKKGDLDADDRANIKKELGDVLFMIASIADLYGVDLRTIAEQNVSKLLSRKARGVIGGSGDNR